ncbi:MAG: hypothetical protein H6753_02895 [Candidatus Omnitrophica bacterium]|nr:hypothetical protein [Candidatus Omnitrophota bacterium]
MRYCWTLFILFIVLSNAAAWAQLDVKTFDSLPREQVIAQTLEFFSAEESSSQQPRDSEINNVLDRLERVKDQVVPEEKGEPSLDLRDQQIKDKLESFERAQMREDAEVLGLLPATEHSNKDVLIKPTMVIQGITRSEVAHHIYSPAEFTKIKNQLILTARGEFSSALRYRISGRAHYDAAYDVGHYYSDSATSDQRAEVELRDTYLDYSLGPWDFRVGKQQIVWGEAVGLFVADVVNAKDLREFILPDFDSIRIPEWGTNLEYTKNNFHSEFIVLPGIEFNKLGVTGSEFAYSLPVPGNAPVTYHDAKDPKDGFENSKLGMRLNYLWEGFDMGAFYLHSWTQSPVLYRAINGGSYDFDPQYKRLDTYGATVSKEIKDIVFKGDFVYIPDDFFPVSNPVDQNGIVQSDHLVYLLSLDYTFLNKLDVNAQFIQDAIFSYNDSMINKDKFNNAFSLRISRDFLNRKLQTEFLMIYGVNAPDFLYQPKVKYSFMKSWQVCVGADIFSGDSSGDFGYFRNKSRYYTELIHKF